MKNIVRFSYLFIFYLKTQSCSLGPPNLDSGPNYFNFLTFDFLLLLLLINFLLQHLYLLAFILEPTILNTQVLQSNIIFQFASNLKLNYFQNRQVSKINPTFNSHFENNFQKLILISKNQVLLLSISRFLIHITVALLIDFYYIRLLFLKTITTCIQFFISSTKLSSLNVY